MKKKNSIYEQKTTIIQDFAHFATTLKYRDIPPRIVEKVKLQIINTITAAKFSDWHEEALKCFKAMEEKEKIIADSDKKATVIPLGKKLTAENAAAINSEYAMSLDYDDYMLVSHMGYSSVLTPLAFLETYGGNIEDLIRIATVVDELTGRLCLSCFFGPLNGQMLTYIHNLGAAVAVGMAMKFDEKTMANALALSLYQPNFCLMPGFYTEGCKLLTASFPLRLGIQSALYAEQGIEGPLGIIEGPLGFFHFFSFHTIPEFVGDLGNSWLCDSLSYKRYPGTSYIAASVDSALDAIKELGFEKITDEDIEKIDKIEIDTTIMSKTIESLSRMQIQKGEDYLDPILINFSVSKSVAYALINGDLLPSHFKQKLIDEKRELILKIIDKIKVRQDIEMTLNQFLTFPNVDYIIARMTKAERKQVLKHLTSANPEKQPLEDRLNNVKKIISSEAGKTIVKTLIKNKIFRIDKKLSLRDVDLPNYLMLQAARTKITLSDGRVAESDFPIPRGGCGLPFEELKSWVRKRYELSFDKNPQQIFTLLNDPKTLIEDFVKELMR